MAEHTTERVIEALLFASSNRMTVDELVELSTHSKKNVESALQALEEKFSSEDSSLKIQHEDEWWKLALKSDYLQYAEKLMPSTELPKPVVETLAMIAWKSPILQSDLVKLRSPAVYDHIMELQKLHLIIRVKQGRSYVLKVTEKFHDYFDIPEDKARELFGEYKEPSEEDDAEFNKGDSFDETDEDREARLIKEIRENKIDPAAIIASDKEFLDDFDKRLHSIEEESSKVDEVLKEAEELEKDLDKDAEKAVQEEKSLEDEPGVFDAEVDKIDEEARKEAELPELDDGSKEDVSTENETLAEEVIDDFDKEIDEKIKKAKDELSEEHINAEDKE